PGLVGYQPCHTSLLEGVHFDAGHGFVAHAEIQREAVLGGLKDGSLTTGFLAGLFQSVAHDSFPVTPPAVRRKGGHVIYADDARGRDRCGGRHRLSVHETDVADEIAVPERLAQKNLAKPVEGNVEAGAANIAEG